MTKLYGFTKIFVFPTFCFGSKAFYFAIRWSKAKKRFVIFKGHADADTVLFNTVNADKWRFFGIITTTDYLVLEKRHDNAL
jgi:hypothetical protein